MRTERSEVRLLLSPPKEKQMKARTFFSDEPDDVVVEIIERIGTTDTYKCRVRDKVVERHRDRLTPLDDKAKELLAKR